MTKTTKKQQPRNPSTTELVFTPSAWLKLQFLCHLGDTEIGAFGVTAGDDPLRVEAVHLVEQTCTSVTTEFDDAAVADYFEDRVAEGLRPDRFARVWLHTHPGSSPEPSGVDEQTFAAAFGGCDHAVMFILARSGATYARLVVRAGRGGIETATLLPVRVDWEAITEPGDLFDRGPLQGEYDRRVTVDAEHRLWQRSSGVPGPLTRCPDVFDDIEPAGTEDLDLLDDDQWRLWMEYMHGDEELMGRKEDADVAC